MCTKFEIYTLTHYKDIKGDEIWVVWGLGVTKVIGSIAILYSAYDFLFDFNRNHASILYHFRVIGSYLLKVANFSPPHLHLSPL